jgi:Ser/Thr protein kinase RdoA (MazF antagonist)
MDRTGRQAESLFPSQSSVLDESLLLEWAISVYPIESEASCRFLTRGDADIYRVKASEANYYHKVYRPPDDLHRAESEARFVCRLGEAGVPVVRAVPRKDGAYASQVLAGEGRRPILLFEEAPRPLPKEPGTERMEALGRAVARLHELADTDDATYELPALDLETFEKELAPHIRRFTNEEGSSFVDAAIEWIRPQLSAIPRVPPGWGICHADLVLSNVREGTEGVTLFDFGSLARTYRGFDLAVIFWSLGRRHPEHRQAYWEAILTGYASIRPLPDRLEQRLPVFLTLRELTFLGGNAATLPLRLGTEPFESSFIPDGFARIRSILSEVGVLL